MDFWVFSSVFAQTSYLFTFCSFAFSIILDKLHKTETETKNPLFCRFCLNMSVFVANKVLIFSDLRLYRANHTPPPTFGTRRVGQLSSENFLFFLFFIFCKILWFCQLCFFTEFSVFLNVSYLFFFLLIVLYYLLLFHEICAWNIMQVSAYLCKIKCIFIQYYDK